MSERQIIRANEREAFRGLAIIERSNAHLYRRWARDAAAQGKPSEHERWAVKARRAWDHAHWAIDQAMQRREPA